jgi:hypothetical protein
VLAHDLLYLATNPFWSVIMLTNTAYTSRSSKSQIRDKAWDEISALEKRFPRIAREISLLWSGNEIVDYIDSLLLDNRGERMGFPIEVLDELMFLAGIRWHVNHLCGTVIESTLPEEFNFTGHNVENGGAPSGTWILL